MLNENIRKIRKSKGLSQEELATKLHVVRQTISKWEKGLSVPDSEMLLALSEELETPTSILLGETIEELNVEDLKVIAEKLEVINLQLAQRNRMQRKFLHGLFIFLSLFIAVIFIALLLINGSYLDWNYADPEMAVAATLLHGFEWWFIRLAPILLAGTLIGVFMTGKKR